MTILLPWTGKWTGNYIVFFCSYWALKMLLQSTFTHPNTHSHSTFYSETLNALHLSLHSQTWQWLLTFWLVEESLYLLRHIRSIPALYSAIYIPKVVKHTLQSKQSRGEKCSTHSTNFLLVFLEMKSVIELLKSNSQTVLILIYWS